MQRTATAVWHGTGQDGTGTLETQSGALKARPFSYKTRFVDESGLSGTNPEELIAAAHAGCFAMQLSFMLAGAGHTPEVLEAKASVTMAPIDGTPTISKIALSLTAKVPGLGNDEFQKLAADAKASCPVSRLLKAEITLDATLSTT